MTWVFSEEAQFQCSPIRFQVGCVFTDRVGEFFFSREDYFEIYWNFFKIFLRN